MRRSHLAPILVPVLIVAACAGNPDRRTLAQLRHVQPDTSEVQVDEGLDRAMQSYRRYLEETPQTARTPEAMRRLADLKIEKEYGILGDGKLIELPAPDEGAAPQARAARPARSGAAAVAAPTESEQDLERRATEEQRIATADEPPGAALSGEVGDDLERAGPLEAIRLYDELLAKYPDYAQRDQVLYQKARAYDELGRTEEAMAVMQQLAAEHAGSRYIDEVQFRRAEHFFTRRKYRDAESAYSAIIARGAASEYHELALYKLGWALYKQEFYEEALHRYFALLDYKVSIGYDFDQKHEEADERRVQDTFQVVSLCFSNLGGPEVVGEYFAAHGKRAYEYRVYRNLGEFYLTKLRYQDAATVYESFVSLYPFHEVSPHFGMRVIEIYEAGGFPKLVLDSKKDFAIRYGLQSEYWRHFEVGESPEVLGYLKSNLEDLANHYHAQYQNESLAGERPANYAEALHWYREFLGSFREDPEAPAINYQLADLMLENRDHAAAAREYERTAYDYPAHAKAAAAGYAAVYAHRENLKAVGLEVRDAARRDTVSSSLRFADAFPDHEHAAVVLGAAADDLYDMKDYTAALAAARKLIERHPNAAAPVRRSAWIVAAHSSFDLAAYPDAETAYTRVLEMTPREDESRAPLVDNLAASIYKQGELANQLGDHRAAADHFLRVRQAAPDSKIRAAAEYDAGAALIRLQDWTAAAAVLDAFRRTFPEHELQREATKQIAFVYRESGQVAQAAGEYERIAAESDEPELRAEALLLAGELHEKAGSPDRALTVYTQYVEQFPRPVELAVETRFRIAGLHKQKRAEADYYEELQEIVRIDAAAGSERTDRTRVLAARAALVLAEQLYQRFAAVMLRQPFEPSLQEKQRQMNASIEALDGLVSYEVAEVTAAATFYIAEVYSNFSRSLLESERPAGLGAAELQEYELALEEEAFPFEEKAIEVHEKNLELLRGGVCNGWTDKSLARLAELNPGRYAKGEISSGFLGSIEYYAYQPPRPERTAPAESTGMEGDTDEIAH